MAFKTGGKRRELSANKNSRKNDGIRKHTFAAPNKIRQNYLSMEPLDERLLESKIFTLDYCVTYRWFTRYPLQWRDPGLAILTKLSN